MIKQYKWGDITFTPAKFNKEWKWREDKFFTNPERRTALIGKEKEMFSCGAGVKTYFDGTNLYWLLEGDGVLNYEMPIENKESCIVPAGCYELKIDPSSESYRYYRSTN